MTGTSIAMLAFSFGFSFHAELQRRKICARCAIKRLGGKSIGKLLPIKKLARGENLTWFEQKRVAIALSFALLLIGSEIEFSVIKNYVKENWDAKRTAKKAGMSSVRNGQGIQGGGR